MYEEYYGFVEKPFNLTPDPKYLYKSESHANAFDLLQYAIKRREGFVVVTGDIGTGKTTLCRALLEQIDRKTFTALVLNPFLSEEDLLKLILQDFGVVTREAVKDGALAGVSKQDLIEALYDFLLSLLPIRATAVLIIDEAQNLPLHVLEQIRILSNLETDKEKLLQILLVGQLNLQPLLRSPELRQLDQRISIRYQLKPLTREETSAYIAHRLTIAGGAMQVTFSPKALHLVHRYSGGIPRLINLLCDRALFGAFSARTNRVTPEMMTTAAANLELATAYPPRWRWLRRRSMVIGAALALAATAAAGVGALAYRRAPVASSPPPAAASAPVPADAAPSSPVRDTASAFAKATADRSAVPPSGAPASEPDRAPALDQPYTILVGSFPTAAPATSAQVAALTGRLRTLGYSTYHVDVDLGARGVWRRVLVGGYSDAGEARRDESRLRQTSDLGEARVITSAFAMARAIPRSLAGGP